LSNRSEFLCKYAEKRLGRSLSVDEAGLISAETSRRAVQDLCDGFSKPKSKPKSKKYDKPISKVIEEVVLDEE
tara:strand:- start:884 stop:1102 length:219 start_codon:yes stop_codon:yes gene_type:complete